MTGPVATTQPGGPAAASSTVASGPRHRHSPRVRRLAADHGVTLEALAGTGPRGRVTAADVLAAAQSRPGDQLSRPGDQLSRPGDQLSRSPVSGPDGGDPLGHAVAERATSPPLPVTQLTTVVEVDMTRVLALRDRIMHDVEQRTGGRLTLMTFVAKATAESLQLHPLLNASIDPGGPTAVRHPRQHLAVTVSTPGGLLTPVLHDAGGLSLMGLARKLTELTDRARSGQLAPADLTGATFTLASAASPDVLLDTQLICPPQVAILSTSAPAERLVVIRTADHAPATAIRSMAYLTLSYDPRPLNSSDTAQFLSTVKTKLEAAQFNSYAE